MKVTKLSVLVSVVLLFFPLM